MNDKKRYDLKCCYDNITTLRRISEVFLVKKRVFVFFYIEFGNFEVMLEVIAALARIGSGDSVVKSEDKIAHFDYKVEDVGRKKVSEHN